MCVGEVWPGAPLNYECYLAVAYILIEVWVTQVYTLYTYNTKSLDLPLVFAFHYIYALIKEYKNTI